MKDFLLNLERVSNWGVNWVSRLDLLMHLDDFVFILLHFQREYFLTIFLESAFWNIVGLHMFCLTKFFTLLVVFVFINCKPLELIIHFLRLSFIFEVNNFGHDKLFLSWGESLLKVFNLVSFIIIHFNWEFTF